MFRPVSIAILTAIAVWTAAADAQNRGGGGAGRGGNSGRGTQSATPPTVRAGQAPRGGQSTRGQRNTSYIARQTDIIILPPLGYYNGAYDLIGSPTGFYPLADWPAPILSAPIGAGARPVRSSDAALTSEIERLSREVAQLRAATSSQRSLPVPQPPPPAPPVVIQPERYTPATLLVLHDGRRLESQNYAIVGETFWILDQGKSQKIPLADIDVDASERENRGRGIRFVLSDK